MMSQKNKQIIVLFNYLDELQYPQLLYEISAELLKCYNCDENNSNSILQQILSQINEIAKVISEYPNVQFFYEKYQYSNLFLNSILIPDFAVHCHLIESVQCQDLSKYDDLIRFALISDNLVNLDSKQLSAVILNYDNREFADLSIRHLCYQLHSELLDSISQNSEFI